jgi:hypothetical protein
MQSGCMAARGGLGIGRDQHIGLAHDFCRKVMDAPFTSSGSASVAPIRGAANGVNLPSMCAESGFCRNEVIFEFPTKSMPSGLRAAAIPDHGDRVRSDA